MATQQTSRYGNNAVSAQNQDTSSKSSTTQSGTSTTTKNGISTTDSVNMDPSSLAALQAIIAQLAGGGTQQMASERATRMGEVNSVQAQRAGYSKDAAFADAQGLMAQTLRQALEQILPSINNAAEAGGASQSSLRTLMLQDAATRAGEASAAQGLNAAVQYGGVANNMNAILEALTRPDNTSINALLSALTIAKGAVTSATTQGNETSTTVGSQQTNESKLIDVGNNGTGSSSGGSRPGGSLTSFGPSATTADLESIVRNAYPALVDSLIANASGGNTFASYQP